MICTKSHSEDISGYIKYMAELTKIPPLTQEQKYSRQNVCSVPLEQKSTIFTHSITSRVFFQLAYMKDKAHELKRS